jgi:uridine kinase
MTRPPPLMIIGIAGGTGSGKTSVARKLLAGLPEGAALTIEHDAFYRDRSDIAYEQRAKLNYDHPDALDNELLLEQLNALRSGHRAELPIYDFKTHLRLAETRSVEPSPVIVVEGILVFVDERIRSLLDMKIFVDTDADIRIMRRVRRDIEDRGRDFDSIRKQYYETVRPMHLQFVEPSKQWADLIIPEGGKNKVALDTVVGKLLYVLSLSK